MYQFQKYVEGRKCDRCDKKATWLPMEKEILGAYCDEHYPYNQKEDDCE